MKVLLDTHSLIWAVNDSPRLSAQAAAIIGNVSNLKLISAVSAYEICLKHRLGKLPEAAALSTDFVRKVAADDAVLLNITVAHAIAAGQLDPSHRDPFDRLLIAQALIEQVPIVSNEALFDRFGVDRLW